MEETYIQSKTFLPLSATSSSPSRITGNNHMMLLMIEELEETMQDFARMNDVLPEINWNTEAVENFVIYFEKVINVSIDPFTQLNKTNHPRSYFTLI